MSDEDQPTLPEADAKDASDAMTGICSLCGDEYSRAGLANSPYCFTCATHATCVCSDASDD